MIEDAYRLNESLHDPFGHPKFIKLLSNLGASRPTLRRLSFIIAAINTHIAGEDMTEMHFLEAANSIKESLKASNSSIQLAYPSNQ